MAHSLRRILVEQEGTYTNTHRACCRKISHGSHVDRLDSRMPTYDEMTSLLTIFRTHSALIIDPALDNHFVNLVKTPSFANHPVNRHYLSELILAIAYICVASSTQSIRRKFGSITPEAAISRASGHFKTAQASFDMTEALENPDVSSIEVLLLMGIYRFLEGMEAAAASLTGMAISMAQTLGMNESDSLSDEESSDIQNGIWNSLYNLDRILSLTSSRMCSLPHDITPLSPTSPVSEASHILGKIIQATRCPSSTPEILQPLSNELKTFITTLPQSLRWSTILSSNLSQHELIRSLHINALYFCAIFRLTKNSLLSTLRRATNRANVSNNSSPFNFDLLASSSTINYESLTATHEARWSEAGIYSAQTSLRIFEKVKQSEITMHGTPLFETWLTLSFLICIAAIFAFPSTCGSPNPLLGALTSGSGSANATGKSGNGTTRDIEAKISQLSQLYQSLTVNAKMSATLCSLSTFINDLRGYLSRRCEDTTCGRDSFEALFGSLGEVNVDSIDIDVDIEIGQDVAMGGDTVELALEEALLTPSGSHEGSSVGDIGTEGSLAALIPSVPGSPVLDIHGSNMGETLENGISSDHSSMPERKVESDVDDLWQKIFEDLEPEDIEPEGLKSSGIDTLGYCLDVSEDVTALERLIRKSEAFV
ncbi:hypothetical protein TWF694_000335 [Orbilia ellipsospora]|uniref:Xylanolytic transcriptional activator regulatory domain-containing protein n=1 Tax=Orbilia ellipsospora TaxID=2528407 RepID=A0AAV9XND0_9PEZI